MSTHQHFIDTFYFVDLVSAIMPKELISDFAAGWLAGGVGLIVGHPLDTVKVRLQTMKYNGVLQCVVTTMKHEAVNGFYKGMLAPVMAVGFLNSLYFTGYGATLKILNPSLNTKDPSFIPPLSQVLLASAGGATAKWTCAVPIEIAKTKLQMQRENLAHFWESKLEGSKKNLKLYSGPVNCFHRIYTEFGVVQGLYRGGFVTYLINILGFSLYMPVYEILNRFLRGSKNKNSLFGTLLAGGAAGCTSWLSILPLDTIKSRIQGQDWEKPKYRGAWHCAKVSYAEEGWKVFFRGWSVLVVRAFPVNAILFLVYSRTLVLFDNLMRDQ